MIFTIQKGYFYLGHMDIFGPFPSLEDQQLDKQIIGGGFWGELRSMADEKNVICFVESQEGDDDSDSAMKVLSVMTGFDQECHCTKFEPLDVQIGENGYSVDGDCIQCAGHYHFTAVYDDHNEITLESLMKENGYLFVVEKQQDILFAHVFDDTIDNEFKLFDQIKQVIIQKDYSGIVLQHIPLGVGHLLLNDDSIGFKDLDDGVLVFQK